VAGLERKSDTIREEPEQERQIRQKQVTGGSELLVVPFHPNDYRLSLTVFICIYDMLAFIPFLSQIKIFTLYSTLTSYLLTILSLFSHLLA